MTSSHLTYARRLVAPLMAALLLLAVVPPAPTQAAEGPTLVLHLESADGTPLTGSGTVTLYRWYRSSQVFTTFGTDVDVELDGDTSVDLPYRPSWSGRFYAVLHSDDGLEDVLAGGVTQAPSGPHDAGTFRTSSSDPTVVPITVSPAPALVRISGRAVDRDGDPVAGLPVAFYETSSTWHDGVTTTGARGRWSFTVRPDRDLALSVGTPTSGDDYDPVQQVNALYTPTLLTVHSPTRGALGLGAETVQPYSVHYLRGRVVLPDGTPARQMSEVDLTPWFGHAWGMYTAVGALTDEDGRFAVRLPAGVSYQVTVGNRHEGDFIYGGLSAPVLLEGDVDLGDVPAVSLEAGTRSLSGRVVGPDGPAAGVTVTAAQWYVGGFHLGNGYIDTTTVTDEDGRYSFSDLPDGWWSVHAMVDGRAVSGAWLGGARPRSVDSPGSLSLVGQDAVAPDLQVRAATSTALAASAPRRSRVSLTATVTVTALSDPSWPDGQVRFLDRGRPVGTAALDPDGVATLSVTELAAGRHRFQARYLGTSTSSRSHSARVTVTVP
ncbi:carboxypeptidase regulatory-like domain-containing protein [Nocardioides sp. GY 10127]|uniref:Ig-like domain repeat protein n=1 Tax=Nocardioides sp. GY 10127 TaxID=2569762 RepID=UPI0010A8E765|nr:carboxypeptidase regulatory-like domain-containing protein [Nocardioides sp. GY 10127]TIC78572.1 hypothetical protein E8D37_19565 [Nocardioides sp. GY 10127]